jgi:CRISPR/Cas system-associated exonuclease Cas4 (RecB family)
MFDRCPKKFHYRYIERFVIPDDDNPVFEKGKYFHALLEHYPEIPEYEFKFKENRDKKMDYIKFITDLCRDDKKIQFLFANGVYREKQFYLDKNLDNCGEEDQLVNGIIDFVGKIDNNIIICDWKSGHTQKYASFEQLKLYAIWVFNEFPLINNVVCFFYFVEQEDYIRLDITREECVVNKQALLNKINNIETTTDFTKTKKEDCQYCPYVKDCNPFKLKVR